MTGINRAQIRQVAYGAMAPNLPPLNNVIYKNFQDEYQSHKYQPYGFSQKKAISLLRANGCTGGPATPSARNTDIYSCPGVGKLSFEFRSTSGNQSREISFQVMQAQLRSVGIELKPVFTLTALTVTLPTRNWDIMLYAWVGTPDPVGTVNIHRCGGTQNHQNYCDRAVSRVLLKSNETLDDEGPHGAVQQGEPDDRGGRRDAAALRAAAVPRPPEAPRRDDPEPDEHQRHLEHAGLDPQDPVSLASAIASGSEFGRRTEMRTGARPLRGRAPGSVTKASSP